LNTFIEVEALTSGRDGNPTVQNTDRMVDVEEFPSPRISKDLRLRHYCEVEHCRANEKILWLIILVSCTEQPPRVS
jgi:hypothetical protein